MATKIADIFAALGLDDSAYTRGLSNAEGKASSFSKTVNGFLERIGQRAFDALISGTQRLISEIGKAVTASSDLSEGINKVGVLFGDSAEEILAFADTADKALGQSKRQAIDAAATFATFGRAAGLSGESLVEFSTDFVGLASDMASFSNTSPEDAIIAIGAALRGESEPIRRYGVLLDDATLRQKALQLGIVSTTANALTPQQRVLAAQVAIYEQTSAAQGDFARTSTGLANAQRILAAEVENGSAKLGNIFRPAVEAITNSLVDIAPQMFGYATNIMDQFANGIAAGIRAIIPAIMVVRQLFSYWFQPGSPPKILPDIAKWAAQTMQVYLDGFSSVDVKSAFDTIGSAIETILRSNVAAGKGSESNLVSSIFGTRAAILGAVAEFARAGSVSEATVNKIVRSAGAAVPGIGALVRSYFELQNASTAATRAQDELNRITEQYDAILDPLRGKLDDVRAEQRKLADQQRLIAAQNVLTSFDSSDAEKRSAQLDIEQIQLESQISTVERQKQVETNAAQAQLDAAKKAEDAAQKKLDIAQAAIDQQVQTNNLLGEQRQLEQRLASEREAEAKRQQQLAEQLHQAQLQYQLGISNTQQKLAILRGELANTTAGTAEYYQLLGQIAATEKQASEEAKRDADKVTDAQFEYNLALADTPGKIALWQQKLASVAPGSAEYFDILTKIHDLQVSLAKGADLGGGGIGAGLTGAVGELNKLQETLGGKNLREAIEEASGPIGEMSEKVKALAESIKALVTQIGIMVGIDFSSWIQANKDATSTTEWDGYGIAVKSNAEIAQKKADEVAVAMKKSADDTTLTLRTLQSDYKVIMDIIQGNWSQFWIDWDENTKIGNEAAKKRIDEGTAGWLERFQWWEMESTQGMRDSLRELGVNISNWLIEVQGKWATYYTEHIKGWDQWLIDVQKRWADWAVPQLETIGNWLINIQEKWAAYYKDHNEKFSAWMGGIQQGWKKGFDQVTKDIGEWFTNIGKKFYEGGASFIKNLKDGIAANLPSLPGWMQGGLQKLTDQLPGSEPKDSSSPLRGLKQRGAALVENFQSGMDAASFNINPLANSLLPNALPFATAGAMTNNTNSTSNSTNNTFHININGGNGDPKAIGTAAKDAILEAMRAAGQV